MNGPSTIPVSQPEQTQPLAPPLVINRDVCRSCGAAISKVEHERTGKRNPLNPAPSVMGNCAVDRDAETYRIATASEIANHQAHLNGGGKPYLYVSHFADCPNAKAHKRR